MHPVKEHRVLPSLKEHHVWGGIYPCDSVDIYPAALRLTRPFPNHPDIGRLEAYFLPTLGLIANHYVGHDGQTFIPWYIDIARIVPGPESWLARDLYLDVVVGQDGKVRVHDTDEYLEAASEGLMEPSEVADALLNCHRLLNGLQQCGNLEAFLVAEGLETGMR